MKWQIRLEKPAKKFLMKQSPKQQKRIVDAIYGLPDAGDIKVMKGHEGLYRLRVGDIRILYTMEEVILTIYVIEIGNRGDIYK